MTDLRERARILAKLSPAEARLYARLGGTLPASAVRGRRDREQWAKTKGRKQGAK